LVFCHGLVFFCDVDHGIGGLCALSFRFSLQLGGRVVIGYSMLQGACLRHMFLCTPWSYFSKSTSHTFFLKTSKVTLNYLLLILFCSSQWNRAVLVACTLGLSYGSLAIEESLDGLCCEECVHRHHCVHYNFWSYNLKWTYFQTPFRSIKILQFLFCIFCASHI
jgi:hypothetical protein